MIAAAVRAAAAALAWLAASAAAADLPVPAAVEIPAGPFLRGSDADEREAAYQLDERAYGHRLTRAQGWYDGERPRGQATTGAYAVTVTPITNRQYAAFVDATGHPVPGELPSDWRGRNFAHPYAQARRQMWTPAGPPPDRLDHPVVLVSWEDARAYAHWLSTVTGAWWRLPTEDEWEKAARGTDGRLFPWGDAFDPARLNSADGGRFDSMPVGSFPAGASPFGVLDASGQVYEWTATPAARAGHYLVKGGSWDDKGCGICRPAASEARPAGQRHFLLGFRLVRAAEP